MTPTPSVCTVCDRVFAKADHLVRHLRRHTGAKPYSCDECSDVLLRHGRAHRHLAKVASARTTPAGSPAPELNPSSDSEFEYDQDDPMAPTNALVAVSVMQLASMAASRASSPVPVSYSPAVDDCLPFSWPTNDGALAPPFVTSSSPSISPRLIEQVFRSWIDVSIDNAAAPPPPAPTADNAAAAATSPLLRIDHAVALRLWPTPVPFEIEASVPTFTLPSPEFLATTLQKHFSTPHGIHSFIHTPTFNPQRHSPMCLLAMCANGAVTFGTPQALKFQHDVLRSIQSTLHLAINGSPPTDLEPLDLIQCVVITIYTALLSGDSLALSISQEMLSDAVLLGHSIELFSTGGPTSYFSTPFPPTFADTERTTREWFSFVGSEVAKRLAFSLLRFRDSLVLSLGPSKVPLFALETFGAPTPCPEALWAAPDAEAWSQLARVTPMTNDALIAEALGLLSTNLRLPPSRSTTSLLHAHLLSLTCHCPLPLLESFVGRSPFSSHAALQTWLDTPSARLAVLHAGQIIRLTNTTPPKTELWDFVAVGAPFQATMVLPAEEETEDRKMEEVNESDVRVAKWVTEGGPITVQGESLRSSRARADLLLGVAVSLEANAALSGASIGKVYAAIVRGWLAAELLE
ncbi:hypothetical protein RQP46_010217 [Phenoliferia psychrophenolica]